MKIFNPEPHREQSIRKMVQSMVEIDTCYKNGLVEKGLGAVIIQRNWRIEYNPIDGWHCSERTTYRTIQQLEPFKSVPVNVTGIDDEDSTSLKNKNLIDLINKYGTEKVISAELAFDPFWFRELKNPSWRYVRVQIQAWEQLDTEAMVALLKLLANTVQL